MINEKPLISIITFLQLRLREKRIETTPDELLKYILQQINVLTRNSWIICSISLPPNLQKRKPVKKSHPVLVTYFSALDNQPCCDAIAYYDYKNNCWRWDEDDEEVQVKILAWMPLPDPYKQEV